MWYLCLSLQLHRSKSLPGCVSYCSFAIAAARYLAIQQHWCRWRRFECTPAQASVKLGNDKPEVLLQDAKFCCKLYWTGRKCFEKLCQSSAGFTMPAEEHLQEHSRQRKGEQQCLGQHGNVFFAMQQYAALIHVNALPTFDRRAYHR